MGRQWRAVIGFKQESGVINHTATREEQSRHSKVHSRGSSIIQAGDKDS